jgi:uncharacterized protein (TIGR03118 family)
MLKRAFALLVVPLAVGALAGSAAAEHSSGYHVRRLVSDQPGHARHLDPNLVNAWGLTAGPTTPWWVANNGTDTSTLFDRTGTAIPLVVSVPGAPTGAVFNGGSQFVVTDGTNSGPALFLFATESGTILGWSPAVPPPAPSTQAQVAFTASDGAIYKGLAIANTSRGPRLYATDFHNGRIDVFDGSFTPISRPHRFTDPAIPSGFAPFGIRNIGGRLFVTYAKQDANREDDVHGPGLGFVDVFGTGGKLLARVATRGPLNAPWGLAKAGEHFGRFSGDLLVGNFGNGQINAYRHHEGQWEHVGTLHTPEGHTLTIDGLWALSFGNGSVAGARSTLFFTAGPDDESHGLFGSIRPQD